MPFILSYMAGWTTPGAELMVNCSSAGNPAPPNKSSMWEIHTVSDCRKMYFTLNLFCRNLQLWPILPLEKQNQLNFLICISGQGSCCCTLYKQAGMQITDCLVDLKSYISQWAYFKSWPQVVWAVPCSPHVRTMWKNLDGFINYLTTFHMRVVRALSSAHAHISTLTSTKTRMQHTHALIGA